MSDKLSLRTAVRALVSEYHIGDYIYDVRDRAGRDEEYVGNSWDHPKVTRFQQCLDALHDYLKGDET